MKPFNLEEAKAGKPVITRDGRPARIVVWNYNPIGNCHILAITQARCGSTSEAVHSFTDTGALTQDRISALDLFMAPVQHTVWVNLYQQASDPFPIAGDNTYPTKAQAEAHASVNWGHLGAFPVTYEE